MIEVKNINKQFKVAKRNPGLKEAAKSLFRREYTTINALVDLSFEIKEGEMVGYIGPNGAGKSSSIKVMSGILTPDSGSCRINGRTPWEERIKHVQDIGVVFGQRSQLWWDVPVIDSFELLRDIYRIEAQDYKKMLNQLTELLNIGEIVRTPARQLSLGQRMRCEIAAALLHNPKVLFLDEPTIGLDAVSKIAVRDFIKSINREKRTTVILTTHDMQDIEALTERILLIGNGRILLDGTLAELKRRNSGYRTLTVDYKSENGETLLRCAEMNGMHGPQGTYETLGQNGMNGMQGPQGIQVIKDLEGHAVFAIDTKLLSVSEAIAYVSRHVDVQDISVASETAEELVVSLYKEFQI